MTPGRGGWRASDDVPDGWSGIGGVGVAGGSGCGCIGRLAAILAASCRSSVSDMVSSEDELSTEECAGDLGRRSSGEPSSSGSTREGGLCGDCRSACSGGAGGGMKDEG